MVNKKRKEEETQENIWNVPNTLTSLRVIITFIIIYLIFGDFSLLTIAIVFLIGMFTDAADGFIARRFKMKTEFGRKYDMIADRFLFIGTILAFIIHYTSIGIIDKSHLLQIFFIMSREIIAFPFAIVNLLSGRLTPHVKTIGKIMTVSQAITFPLIILDLSFSIYFAIATGIIGIFAARRYILDSVKR